MPSEVAAEAPRLHGYQPTQLSDDDDDGDADVDSNDDVDSDGDGDSRTRTYRQVKGLPLSYFTQSPFRPPVRSFNLLCLH